MPPNPKATATVFLCVLCAFAVQPAPCSFPPPIVNFPTFSPQKTYDSKQDLVKTTRVLNERYARPEGSIMRASDIRRGQAVMMDGKLFVVTNADHNTPDNLRAKVQFKLRDVGKGTIQDKRVGATDDIETATLDRRQVEYLYSDNEGHVLMDLETYDQNTIP